MGITDWLGNLFSVGGSLGDLGSGLVGGTNVPVNEVAPTGFDSSALTAAQGDIGAYQFDTGATPVTPVVDNPFSISGPQTGAGSPGASSPSILGMDMGDAFKIGASLYNDYENRKVQKAVANTNIKTKQNARERSSNIQKQMTGGTGLTSGSDYKEIS